MEQGNGISELKVAMARIEQSTADMSSQLRDIKHDIKGLEQSNQAIGVLAVRVNTVEDRVASLEDSQKWVVRVMTGAIITAVMGLILIKTGIGIKIG